MDAVDLVDVLGESLERAFEAREPRLHQRRQRRRSVDAGRLGAGRSGRAGGRRRRQPCGDRHRDDEYTFEHRARSSSGSGRGDGAVRPWTVHRRYGPRRGGRARPAAAGRRPAGAPGTATPPGGAAHRRSVACAWLLIRLIPALAVALAIAARRGVRLGLGGRRERRFRARCPISTRSRRDGIVVVRAGPPDAPRVPARVPLRGAQRRRRAADHRRSPRGRRPRDAWSPTRSSCATARRARVVQRRRPAPLRRLARPPPLAPAALRALRAAPSRQHRSRWSRDRKTGFCLGDRYAVDGSRAPARAAARVTRAAAGSADRSCSGSAKGSPSATATTTRPTSRASTSRSPGSRTARTCSCTGSNADRRIQRARATATTPRPCASRCAGAPVSPYIRVRARCADSARCDG